MMHALDPAEAVEVLNLLLKFFGDGERWIKGRFSDRRGNCCLVGALDFVSSHHAIKGDAAERYLADAVSDERGQQIRRHENGEDYAKLRAALRRAMRREWYRASETLLRRDILSDFNDGCKDFAELRALIVQARATAMNDADPGRRRARVSTSSTTSWLWLRGDALAASDWFFRGHSAALRSGFRMRHRTAHLNRRLV